jgi:hypothetical protein
MWDETVLTSMFCPLPVVKSSLGEVAVVKVPVAEPAALTFAMIVVALSSPYKWILLVLLHEANISPAPTVAWSWITY